MWFTHAHNYVPQVCQLVPSAVPEAMSVTTQLQSGGFENQWIITPTSQTKGLL